MNKIDEKTEIKPIDLNLLEDPEYPTTFQECINLFH